MVRPDTPRRTTTGYGPETAAAWLRLGPADRAAGSGPADHPGPATAPGPFGSPASGQQRPLGSATEDPLDTGSRSSFNSRPPARARLGSRKSRRPRPGRVRTPSPATARAAPGLTAVMVTTSRPVRGGRTRVSSRATPTRPGYGDQLGYGSPVQPRHAQPGYGQQATASRASRPAGLRCPCRAPSASGVPPAWPAPALRPGLRRYGRTLRPARLRPPARSGPGSAPPGGFGGQSRADQDYQTEAYPQQGAEPSDYQQHAFGDGGFGQNGFGRTRHPGRRQPAMTSRTA